MTQADAVAGRLAGLRGSGSPYLPSLGEPDATLAMSPDERRAYNEWLHSDPEGDAIAGGCTAAGQRMDEVIDSLEHR